MPSIIVQYLMIVIAIFKYTCTTENAEDRYGSLLTDLQQAGFSVNLVTIEVGCLGHFMPQTVSKLSDVCHLPKNTIRCILQQAARVAISCSYRIFNSRASTTWDVVDLFTC